MSGICGYIGPDYKKKTIEMSKALSRRGADGEGFYEDTRVGLSIGHRRSGTALNKHLPGGPVKSRVGRFVLSFDGAIYNHSALRAQVLATEHNRTSEHRNIGTSEHRNIGTSDEEIFVESIAVLGLDKTLELTVGAFAFCLYDIEGQTLYLARDRAGEKPLYYGSYKGAFFFTSDLISIRAAGISPPLDLDALQLYFDHGYFPAPYTVYEGVSRLRAAHVIRIELPFNGIPESAPYWDINALVREAYLNPYKGGFDDAVEELGALINDSVRMQIAYGGSAGALLSGGVDSSLIAAVMQSQSAAKIKTFTIGFHDAESNEAEYAKKIAEHIGTDHTELYVTEKDATDVIGIIPDIYSEPFADSSQIPTYLVHKLAKQSVSAVLGGDSADELFGGYTKYTSLQGVWAKAKRIPARAVLGTAAGFVGGFGFELNNDRISRGANLLKSKNDLEAYAAISRTWRRTTPLVIDAKHDPLYVMNDPELAELHTDMARLMMDADFRVYMPDDCVVKVERAAAFAGVGVRTPLLDKRIIEFAYRLPVNMKIKDGVHKRPLRQLLYRSVPKELLERPKHGFSIPVRTWLTGPLREWAEDLLSESLLRRQGLLRADWVRGEWKRLLRDETHNGVSIWSVLMFQLWYERYERC